MISLPYNPSSKDSIISYAKKLIGKNLKEFCPKDVSNYKNKGGFGQFLEKYYFLYEPNSLEEPDFSLAKLELKSSPLKELKNLKFVSKERLVLNIINYIDIVNQDFEFSSFYKKNKNLLLVFYLHKVDETVFDYKIKIVDEWNFPSLDLELIKQDFLKIKEKILNGKAHELSEADTLYLGACTKGSKGGNKREQPNSNIKAKQRAFSLKQGYVNHIIASLSGNKEKYGKVIDNLEVLKKKTFEEVILDKFKAYYGKTVSQIINDLNIELNYKAKNFYANLTKAILNIKQDCEIEEFKKADIEVRTVRLKNNNLPKEDISFKAFKYEDIMRQNWNSSEFKEILEKKFLFIFFKYYGDELKLEKVKFWNISNDDLQIVRKMWIDTKKIIISGNIVKEIKTDKNGKIKRYTNFPGKKDNYISHVRPHGQNSQDVFSLPIEDKLTREKFYTKHCFWLNASFVKEKIFKDI